MGPKSLRVTVYSSSDSQFQLVDYLNTGSVLVQIMGKQYVRKSAVAAKRGLTTKDMLRSDRGVFSK